MSAPRRTDIHRPGSPDFNPGNYECHGVFDLGDEWNVSQTAKDATVAALLGQGYTFDDAPHGAGQCSHCGHPGLRYVALLSHEPTKTLMYAGETCLHGRFAAGAKAEFTKLRAAARTAPARLRAARELVARCPKLAPLLDPNEASLIAASDFLTQIARTLRATGRLTNKQQATATTVLDKFMAARARRATAVEPGREPIPVDHGKIALCGKIVKIEERGDAHDPRLTMMFVDDRGFRLFGNVPRAVIERVDRARMVGLRLAFTGVVRRQEPYFGFVSRAHDVRPA